jgi:hypothetical protein
MYFKYYKNKIQSDKNDVRHLNFKPNVFEKKYVVAWSLLLRVRN